MTFLPFIEMINFFTIPGLEKQEEIKKARLKASLSNLKVLDEMKRFSHPERQSIQ